LYVITFLNVVTSVTRCLVTRPFPKAVKTVKIFDVIVPVPSLAYVNFRWVFVD